MDNQIAQVCSDNDTLRLLVIACVCPGQRWNITSNQLKKSNIHMNHICMMIHSSKLEKLN